MKAHFIGIGGVGMSAAALLLRQSGWEITGSDEEVYPPISTLLEKEDIAYRTPYSAMNIPPDTDVIVIGKNAKLVPETNVEVAAAQASGKKILSFPEVLATLSEGRETVVVAGSYGKSSCAALLAHCLESARLDPSYFIGAVPLTPAASAHLGEGPLFVIEGDEYPASNTDSRSKFLLLRPSHVLLGPLAHDHVNVFPAATAYLEPFEQLLKLLPENGSCVACIDGPLSKQFLSKITRPTVTYGLHEGNFHAIDISYGDRTTFTLVERGSPITLIETSQLGEHSVQNIVGVAAFLLSRHLLSPTQLTLAVQSFRGVQRRLDRKSEQTRIPIFEGFGSSYEKAKAAVAAMRLHFPARRLVIVFEPHTFSWRNRAALPWYDDVFAGSQRVYVYEPATQGADTHEQLSQAEIVERIKASGTHAEPIGDRGAALKTIGAELAENDCVLLLTSGDLGGLIESVPKLAEEKFPV